MEVQGNHHITNSTQTKSRAKAGMFIFTLSCVLFTYLLSTLLTMLMQIILPWLGRNALSDSINYETD